MPGFTKQAIKANFLKLPDMYPLLDITVKMIDENCGINRKSFYYHYQDTHNHCADDTAADGADTAIQRRSTDNAGQHDLQLISIHAVTRAHQDPERIDQRTARSEQAADHKHQRLDHINVYAGQPCGTLVAAGRIDILAEAGLSENIRHDKRQHEPDQRRYGDHTGDLSHADDIKCLWNAGDRLCTGNNVDKAADRGLRAERRNERVDADFCSQEAVDQAAHDTGQVFVRPVRPFPSRSTEQPCHSPTPVQSLLPFPDHISLRDSGMPRWSARPDRRLPYPHRYTNRHLSIRRVRHPCPPP